MSVAYHTSYVSLKIVTIQPSLNDKSSRVIYHVDAVGFTDVDHKSVGVGAYEMLR